MAGGRVSGFCDGCPDHEACATGAPCSLVKLVQLDEGFASGKRSVSACSACGELLAWRKSLAGGDREGWATSDRTIITGWRFSCTQQAVGTPHSAVRMSLEKWLARRS